MKNMFLILSILFLFTGCNEEEPRQQENSIYGTWKLVSFVNESINSVISEIDFQNSNQITINFKENRSFTGSTIRNNFFGNYSSDKSSKELIFFNFSTTEINESEWGDLFYTNLNSNFNQQTKNWESTYSIQNNNLKIYYSEQEYMIFEKL